MVSNRLSQHLEVKLGSEKSGTKDPAPVALPAYETMASYVVEHNKSRVVKVCVSRTSSESGDQLFTQPLVM